MVILATVKHHHQLTASAAAQAPQPGGSSESKLTARLLCYELVNTPRLLQAAADAAVTKSTVQHTYRVPKNEATLIFLNSSVKN